MSHTNNQLAYPREEITSNASYFLKFGFIIIINNFESVNAFCINIRAYKHNANLPVFPRWKEILSLQGCDSQEDIISPGIT